MWRAFLLINLSLRQLPWRHVQTLSSMLAAITSPHQPAWDEPGHPAAPSSGWRESESPRLTHCVMAMRVGSSFLRMVARPLPQTPRLVPDGSHG